MSEQPPPPEAALNEDQRAVVEYLHSDEFAARRVLSPERLPRSMRASMPFCGPGWPSLIAGPAGLAMIALAFAVLFPLAMEAVEDRFTMRPSFLGMSLLIQTLSLPPLIAFAFAAVTPMFWYGPLTARFVIALGSTLPACIGFVGTLSLIEDNPPNDFWFGFSIVMWTAFVTSLVIAVSVQMWTRWTMTHSREEQSPLPPTGLSSMIELTAIAAIGCAVFVSTDLDDYLIGMMVMGGISGLMSTAVLFALVAYFRAGQSRTRPIAFAVLSAIAAAAVLNGFIASMEFGWQVLAGEAILILAASLYGALILLSVSWLCLRWLRACGWKCVHRRSTA